MRAYLPEDCKLNMYHPEFLGAGMTVRFDVLFVQQDGVVILKFLLVSVVYVRPTSHADELLFLASVALMKNRLYNV